MPTNIFGRETTQFYSRKNFIFYIGLIYLLTSSNPLDILPNSANTRHLENKSNSTLLDVKFADPDLTDLNLHEIPDSLLPNMGIPEIQNTEPIGDTHRTEDDINQGKNQENTALATVLRQIGEKIEGFDASEVQEKLTLHSDINDFTRGGITFANRDEEALVDDDLSEVEKEELENNKTKFTFNFIVDSNKQDPYAAVVFSGLTEDNSFRNNPHNYSWDQYYELGQYTATSVIFDEEDGSNPERLARWTAENFTTNRHNVMVSNHPVVDSEGNVSHYITSMFAHSGFQIDNPTVPLAFESFRYFIQSGIDDDGLDLVTDQELLKLRMQALLGNRIMFTQNGKSQEFEIVGVTSYEDFDDVKVSNLVDKLIKETKGEEYNYYFQNLKNPANAEMVIATTCSWKVEGSVLVTDSGRYIFLLKPVGSSQGQSKFNLPQAPAEEYILEAKSGVGAGVDGGVGTETDAESGSSTQSSSATEVEIIDLTETIDYKPIPVTNQEYANFIINANMAIDERFGANMSNFEEFTLSSLDKVEEEFEVQVFKNALSSESAKMIVRFFNKNQDGSELSNTQVDDLLQSIPILYGESIDNYLKLRGGSWGTTPMSIGEDGTPSFNSLAFGEAPLKKKFIDKNLILEELLQMYQYREVLKIYKAGQMLGLKREVEIEVIDNNGVKHNVINSYEYKTSEFGLDLFHYELVNGNTRAFLELIQQKYKIENNISGNAYDFVFIKNGEKMVFRVDPNNPDVAVNEAFKFMLDNVVPIIGEKANGEKYTAEDFLIAESLAAINQKFFEKTGSSIFEIVGISRYNKTIVAPSYDFDISNTGLNNDSEGSEVAKNSKNIKNDKNIKVQNVGFTARNYKPNISELQELTEEARMPKPKTSREMIADIVRSAFTSVN